MASVREQALLLQKDGAPTTFLDALQLVRRPQALTAEDIEALIALHDAKTTTDGAREVIADFLRGQAQSMAHERQHADRLLTLADSGKSIRGRKGTALQLKLETRTHRGGIWDVKSKSDHVVWEFLGLDKDRRYTLSQIKLERGGTAHIELVELLAPPKKSHARSQKPVDDERTFTLEVVIESERQA